MLNFWVYLRYSFRNKILLLLPIVLILKNFVLTVPSNLILNCRILILIFSWFLYWKVYSLRILWRKTQSVYACIENTIFNIFKSYLAKFHLFFCFFLVQFLEVNLIFACFFLRLRLWRWGRKSYSIITFFKSIYLYFFEFLILLFFFFLFFYLFYCLFT